MPLNIFFARRCRDAQALSTCESAALQPCCKARQLIAYRNVAAPELWASSGSRKVQTAVE